MPPTVSVYYTRDVNQQTNVRAKCVLSHAIVFTAHTCVKHIDFLKVSMQATTPHSQAQCKAIHVHTGEWFLPSRQTTTPCNGPTTSFLTASTLIYAFGAGITAAAGTRLALQLLVTHHIGASSFQSQDMNALHCYVLLLPPCFKIGKFARLLPSLDVVAMFKAPSPESNPNSPSPVDATISQYHTNQS